MAYTQVYRSGTARVLGAASVVVAVSAIATVLVYGTAANPVRYLAPFAMVGTLGWLAYWRPRVVLDEQGVSLHNVFREVMVPWPAVRDVHSRYGLRLDTAYGDFNAWAVPAPVGRARARGTETEAAAMVRQRLERLRAHNELGVGPGGSDEPQVRVDAAALAVVITLALASAAGFLLG
ncbi:PH domain-containing protein [Nocardioides sp.]|uniref:PH domain-containing protein n=1 Tax=Nocardioides sp. TaxID=35761 RepID=UPI00273672A0|nr:PH domain-containing protein [Nocardioides sp.]MDP3890346.1 PH domain-containing protein [Nocardioides sp.]